MALLLAAALHLLPKLGARGSPSEQGVSFAGRYEGEVRDYGRVTVEVDRQGKFVTTLEIYGNHGQLMPIELSRGGLDAHGSDLVMHVETRLGKSGSFSPVLVAVHDDHLDWPIDWPIHGDAVEASRVGIAEIRLVH